jgi:transmembrane sensor
MEKTDSRRSVFEEASEWWVRLHMEGASLAEREAFVDWLRESPAHVAEFLSLAPVHDGLDRLENWGRNGPREGGELPENVVALPGFHNDVTQRRRRQRGWKLASVAAAAAAASVVAVASIWMLLRPDTVSTGRGERRELVLADGSILSLDPQTRAEIDFNSRQRHVILREGRALFRVALERDRPFVVHVDGAAVQALGTAFGVERRSADVLVTVSEGRVSVTSQRTDGATPQIASRNERVELAAGEQVAVQPAESGPVRLVDAEQALAWAQGRLVFQDHTVAEAIAQFNRYNHLQLHVADPQLAARAVSGIFDASDPHAFLAFMQSAASIHLVHDREGHVTIVVPP